MDSSCFTRKSHSVMNRSSVLTPSVVKVPDRIGSVLRFSKSPARSVMNIPVPDPSCPSFMTSMARSATIGEIGSELVIANKRHIHFPSLFIYSAEFLHECGDLADRLKPFYI